MTMFGQMADRWFLELLNAGFAASAAVLVVLLLRLPLRRAAKEHARAETAPAWAPTRDARQKMRSRTAAARDFQQERR